MLEKIYITKYFKRLSSIFHYKKSFEKTIENLINISEIHIISVKVAKLIWYIHMSPM
jgi:hypothetical protein